MKSMKSADVIIIGAGLTGLSLAYFLRKSNLKILLLEARNRPGGRIHTLYGDGLPPREMGATWLGKKHQKLNDLLAELELPIFPQRLGKHAIYEPLSTSPPQRVQLPPNDAPSYRIQGGTTQLINQLLNKIQDASVSYGVQVESISIDEMESGKNQLIRVKSYNQQFEAPYVVSTLPPFLLRSTISCNPALPTQIGEVLDRTHTWMGESIKVSFTYQEPFWRATGQSGTIFSNVGPIPEMYDHADYEEKYFALKGFFNGSYYSLTAAARREMALSQLEKYFGPQVRDFTSYDETVWTNEPFTYHPYDGHVLPHQNNGHPLLSVSLYENQFFIAGSETAREHPGYMDGAVSSARFVADQILQHA